MAYVELRRLNKSQSTATGKTNANEALLNQSMVAVDNIKRALRRAVNMELTMLICRLLQTSVARVRISVS